MVAEKHRSRTDSDAKWDAVEKIDELMERIRQVEIPEGFSLDSRKGDAKVAAVE
ncbi:hypothetical protein N9J72_01675 [Candidatus Gracilibacteria bacterium]|nr:hypothetical protein [Candidatus Gracilibacteria bacterium]